jgi:type VI protein secretion system component VasF
MSHDLERVAQLLAALPPAPRGWVEAAQELPLARERLDELVARAQADERFRQIVLADLEAALAAEGYEPDDALVRALRTRLSHE